ncbi:MAG: hypothetical protein MZV70_02610 [Desulfobacterales bacterium]|nr:hypothetical protein [Desulfobacterales bacterium]
MRKDIGRMEMAVKEVYSMCGMCAVRCPIKVEVENDAVTWIEGNPHVPGIEGQPLREGVGGHSIRI